MSAGIGADRICLSAFRRQIETLYWVRNFPRRAKNGDHRYAILHTPVDNRGQLRPILSGFRFASCPSAKGDRCQ
ncbi:hypothetical protein SBC1_70920 (plasmid) [Caballeronia sp. SBC1]|nr:hypothetical protein SBC2_70660 [Caballeronia sp. SBC2]QIN67045.1 hypothetical protein SBC1_70920 [Caballeronia sp. SBC1]